MSNWFNNGVGPQVRAPRAKASKTIPALAILSPSPLVVATVYFSLRFRIIGSFGIKARNAWTKEKQAKGYDASEVRTLQSRYSSSLEASEASQTANGHDEQGFCLVIRRRRHEAVDEFWDRIKAEHAAKRAAPNGPAARK